MKNEKDNIHKISKVKYKIITHDFHNAYFNLASEEYLLKQKSGYYIYLWINEPAVIVGINQNTLLEVNLGEAEKKNIKIVRRLTGGGAVYHDLNNVCYTVIAPYNSQIDNYKEFCSPVVEYLNSIGVKAEFTGRNDISVEGKKISGNAQTVYDEKIMHHGTLLFNTDMGVLSSVLIQNKLKIESKGIKSIRARVTNIFEHLEDKMTTKDFYFGLKNWLNKNYEEYTFSEEDIENINKLVKEKYSTYEWNIGRSPKGKNRFDYRFSFGTISILFDLKDGLIENFELFGDFFSKKNISEFCENINGKKFDKNQLYNDFQKIDEYIVNGNGTEILDRLFS